MHFIAAGTVQHWYTNGTVIGITGVAVGFAAIVISIVLWRFGTPRGLLEYSMPASIRLVSRSPNVKLHELQVSLRGKVVQDPCLSTLHIANNGNRDIRIGDFDQDNPLTFYFDTEILEILSSSSPDGKIFSLEGDDKLCLLPRLLKRGQKIRIDVLTEGTPTLTCTGTLADVKVRFQTGKPKLSMLSTTFLVAGNITYLLGFILMFSWQYTWSFSRRPQLPHLNHNLAPAAITLVGIGAACTVITVLMIFGPAFRQRLIKNR